MSRPLRVLRAGDAREVQDALAAALSGDGPALLPVAADAPAPPAPETVAPEVALVVLTSGSTGDAKLVALTADAVRSSSVTALQRLGGSGQWLLALPAHYIAGLNVLARSIEAGTEPVLLPSGPFDPGAFAEAAAQLTHATRFTSLVPAQLGRLLDDPDGTEALVSFSSVLVGGQATPRSVLERARDAGISLVRTYGSSETTGGCVYDGTPLDGTRVLIADGEVLIAGPTLALGYLDETATERAFILREGVRWFRTGDTGEVVDGVLTVTGRLDDQIVSGGVNVSIGAIENIVRRMPQLTDAVVVAIPSERWGAVPVVAVADAVDLDGVTLEGVRAAVKSALGPAAAPAAIVRVSTIPLLPSGKPDRVSLAAAAAQ